MKPSPTVTAPRRYSITIVGDTAAVWRFHRLSPTALAHHLTLLFTGQEVYQDELARFGFQIWIEPDPDALPEAETGSGRSGGKD